MNRRQGYRRFRSRCCTQQDIAIVTFYHRIDTWLSAIRKLETGEIVRSEEKTVITNVHDGFDFLGFNIRKYGKDISVFL